MVGILFINHFLACLWAFASKFDSDSNWVLQKTGVKDQSTSSLYLMSFYFITTTVTTVGYGDISPANSLERIFSVVILFIGVMCFASISGSLTSIISQNDNQQAGLKQKMETIQNLKKQYKL